MMKWTEAQQEAIKRSGTDILVSAGAGSGKTAVLTARVIDRIRQGTNINELLILTFTKAAALEMKDRIRSELGKHEEFLGQMALLDSSYITTFDSFALSLVNKYHHILNINQGISIAPESLVEVFTLELLDQLFEERYASKDQEFLNLISSFCMKDDSMIRDAVKGLNEKLDQKVYKKEYLQNYFEEVFTEDMISRSIDVYVEMIREKVRSLEPLVSNLLNECDQRNSQIVKSQMEKLQCARTYKELQDAFYNDLPRKTKDCGQGYSDCRTALTKALDGLSALLKYEDVSGFRDEAHKMEPVLKVIIPLVRELDERIDAFKKEHQIYTFYDIAKLAIRLVKGHPDVRKEIMAGFKEIMIDEYQDTSDIQEELISLISGHNVYMVGDIKQSIYRFRNANPSLFKEKYASFTDYRSNPKPGEGIKIDLLENFRSRCEVLDTVNEMFDHMMTEDMGGADYRKSHRMVYGNHAYDTEKAEDNMTELLNYSRLDDNFSNPEKEAFVIAHDIKAKLNKGYQVFDKETKKLRKATYRDFTILIDRGKDFELYKKIFEYLQIPLSVHKDESLSAGYNFLILKNIMKFILKVSTNEVDTAFNYLYTSIARSFLFQIPDEEIFVSIKNNTVRDSEIYRLSEGMAKKLTCMSNEEFVRDVIHDFHFYDKVMTVGDLDKAYAETEYLLELARGLNDCGMGISSFVEHLEKVIDYGLNLNYTVNLGSENAVKLMTVHKSKGLEFGVCYYSGLASKFNISEVKESFLCDSRFGLIVPYFDNGIKETYFKELFKYNYNCEEISEKIRLFYVALTRAKEKIIIVDSIGDDDVLPADRMKWNSFKTMLETVISRTGIRQTIIPYHSIALTDKYHETKSLDFQSLIKGGQKIEVCDITPHLPVSQIDQTSKKHYSKISKGILSAADRDKMELGNQMHYILEVLDFAANDVNDQIDALNINEVFKKRIRQFASSELLKKIKEAKVYKEYEFITDEAHGFIDLMCEYDNHIDIIDYKLKEIKDEAYKKQLNGYKDYILQRTGKPAKAYIYSIFDGSYEEV